MTKSLLIILLVVFLVCGNFNARPFTTITDVPCDECQEQPLTITSLTISPGTIDAWSWTQSGHEYGCLVQMLGLLSWKSLRLANQTVTLMGSLVKKSNKLSKFGPFNCTMRTASHLADEEFGRDNKYISAALNCQIPRNIPQYRDILEQHSFCDVAMTSSMQYDLHYVLNGMRSNLKFASSPLLGHGVHVASIAIKSAIVCAVQTFRNELTPFMIVMFVAYYLDLGYHVVLYDKAGLHQSEILQSFQSNIGRNFDYFPETICQLFQRVNSSATHKIVEDPSVNYKIYYRREQGHFTNHSSESTPPVAVDTSQQDRDKTLTYDHCRMQYSSSIAILFVDIDEYFHCAGEEFANTFEALGNYQRSQIEHASMLGFEEIRVDSHPYAAVGRDVTVQSIHNCLRAANGTFFPPHSSSGDQVFKRYETMHKCFTGLSSYQTWPKSWDLARKCPFHYNHWSCDGGRGGGRQSHCHCKVNLEMWYKFSKRRVGPIITQDDLTNSSLAPLRESKLLESRSNNNNINNNGNKKCHLVHYNYHLFNGQESRGLEKRLTDHAGFSPIAALYHIK